ncbi:LysR substrate-binding domain-containing protein [Pseudomonas abieticivorans]|uniref:LysR substrate-binding domain-containing protein n=1 Tax=Pseudomonas abieticivorans TaxID=2931382 RepID=UPI0020C14B90|nr:LysR substrate-binding domain-containing protein [Pseudomonas sp. PIA16]
MSLSTINLRHLRVFLAVVQHGSLQKAAQMLHITLSAVSKSLKELEDELGQRLVERGRRGMRLTQAGEAFQTHAAQAMSSFNQALTLAHSAPGQPEVLRIGALPTAAGYMLAPAVALMQARHPEVQIQVLSGVYEYLVAKLRTHDLDLIVGRLIGRDMLGVSFEALYEEDLVLVVHRDHPLAGREQLELDDLRPYTLLASPPGTLVRITVDNFLLASGAGAGFRIVESLSETFSRVFTHDHQAVWFVQRGLVNLDLRLGLLVPLPFASPLLKAPVGLTTPTDHPQSNATRAFAEILRRWQPQHP